MSRCLCMSRYTAKEAVIMHKKRFERFNNLLLTFAHTVLTRQTLKVLCAYLGEMKES